VTLLAHYTGGFAMQPHTASTPTQSQTPVQAPALKVKTHLKAGGIIVQH
jgi:hypothetical protein